MVNPAMATMHGSSVEELLNVEFDSFVHPDHRPMLRERGLARQRGENVPSRYEVKILKKNGDIRWVEIDARRITYNGQPAVAGTVFDITDRKLAASEMCQSEEQYRLLADNVHDVIWTMDLQGRFTYVSPSVYKLRGYTVQEVMRQTPDQALCAGSIQHLTAGLVRITQAIQQGLPFPDNVFELEQPCKDGSTVWTEATITGLYNAERELIGILGVTRDISIQKRIRDALAESEDRLSFVMQATNDGLWDWWPLSGKTYFSPQYYYMLGFEMNEFPASLEAFRELIHPDDLPRVDTSLDRALADNKGFDIELRLRTKDGHWKWILDRGRIKEWDVEGRPLRLVGTHIDISARKAAEQQLAENELRLRTILQNVPGFIFQLQLGEQHDIRFNYAGAAVAMFGLTPATLVGKADLLLDLIEAGDRESLLALIADAARQQSGWHFKFRMHNPAGGSMWVEANAAIQESGGALAVWTGFMVDISDRVQLETEMLRAIEQADSANAAKSQFLANMSHEIRTPMNAILGFSELLLGTPLDSKQKEYLNKIGTASQSLLFLINDILDVSKIEAGKLELECGAFSLRMVLEKVSTLLQDRAHDKGLGFHVSVGEGVPDRLAGDSHRLEQVLLNLVSNAVKFTDHGAVMIRVDLLDDKETITAETGQPATLLRFAVEDTGIGISEQQQQKLFQPFQQADGSTTRKYGGTGLGLTIARSLVELMGGRLMLASTPGRGSCFSFTLGFVLTQFSGTAQLDASEWNRTEALLTPDTNTDLSGCRVLLVEDNEFNRQLASELLRERGVMVDIVENGAQAVDKVFQGLKTGRVPYDAVLMDVQMPVMDGFEACRLLRCNPLLAELPIIALTARAVRGDRDKCLAAGMNDFVAKPINRQKFFAVLARWLKAGDKLFEDLPAEASKPVPAGKNRLGEADRSSTAVSPSVGFLAELTRLDCDSAIEWLGNNPDLYQRVVSVFLGRYQDELKDLEHCFHTGELSRIGRLAHTLKSEAGTLGAQRLAVLAEKLEEASRYGSLDDGLFRALVTELDFTVRELRLYLDGSS